jgi:hypothetical protein
VPVDEAEVITLQYNSPLTLPWRRRNELAIVVTIPEPPAEPVSAAAAPDKEEAERVSAAADLDKEEAEALQALETEYAERSAAIRRRFDADRRDLGSEPSGSQPELPLEDSLEDTAQASPTDPPTDSAESLDQATDPKPDLQ